MDDLYRIAWTLVNKWWPWKGIAREDLVQEMVLAAWQALPKRRCSARTVMHCRLLDIIRKQSRFRANRPAQPSEASEVYLEERPDVTTPSCLPDTRMETRDSLSAWAHRHNLDRIQYLILILRYGAELNEVQTGAVVGYSGERIYQIESQLIKTLGMKPPVRHYERKGYRQGC